MEYEISLCLYPGILLGFRSYNEALKTTHVLYLPFVDVALTIFNTQQDL